MEIKKEDLESMVKTVLSAINAMDRAVEICDEKNQATAMAFLGAESHKVANELHRVEESNEDVKKIINRMDPKTDEEKLEEVVRGEAEVEELFEGE